jgi:hypothetical protein
MQEVYQSQGAVNIIENVWNRFEKVHKLYEKYCKEEKERDNE